MKNLVQRFLESQNVWVDITYHSDSISSRFPPNKKMKSPDEVYTVNQAMFDISIMRGGDIIKKFKDVNMKWEEDKYFTCCGGMSPREDNPGYTKITWEISPLDYTQDRRFSQSYLLNIPDSLSCQDRSEEEELKDLIKEYDLEDELTEEIVNAMKRDFKVKSFSAMKHIPALKDYHGEDLYEEWDSEAEYDHW